MDNPALSMLCEAIKPELLRLEPGQSQIVALPDTSLVGDIEQDFAACCEQRGFSVMRNQTAGGVVLTIGKPVDTGSAAGL